MTSITASSVAALFEFPARVFGLAGDLFTEAPRDPEGPVSVVGIGRIVEQCREGGHVRGVEPNYPDSDRGLRLPANCETYRETNCDEDKHQTTQQ
jgi:hypothetical protein